MGEELGDALRRARRRAGLTLSDLAELVGVSPATLSRAETGRGRLTSDRLRRCADAVGVDVEELRKSAGDAEVEIEPDPTGGTRGLFAPHLPPVPWEWRTYEKLELSPALRAALSSFLDLGYHGSSVRGIAEIAGLSVPGLYHHYPSKQSLLVALMEMQMRDFYSRCEAARADGDSARMRFVQLVECFALFHTNRRAWAFIGASEMRSLEEPHRRRIAEIRNSCQRMVDEEVLQLAEEGLLGTELPDDASRAVVTMLVGIANWYRIEGPLTPEEIAQRYVKHATALVQLEPARAAS